MFFSHVNWIIDPDPQKSIQNAPPTIYQFVQCSSKQKQIKSFKILWVPVNTLKKLKQELL